MHSFRFLIVDGSQKTRTMIANTIKNELGSLNSALVEDAAKAMQFLAEGNIDVALVEAELEGSSSGIDLLREVRENDELKDTPIILMTGRPSQQLIEEALSLKVNQIVVKPFSVADIESKLREVCKGLTPKTPSTGKNDKRKSGGVSEISWNKA